MLGSTENLGSPLTGPVIPAWSPGTNPGSVPQSYTVTTQTTLPGGTYWFTSLTIRAQLSFSGPAVVYVNGQISQSATLARGQPAAGRPDPSTSTRATPSSAGAACP